MASVYGGSPAQRRQSIEKSAGKGPVGTLIQPESANSNSGRGSNIGGLQDPPATKVPRSQMGGAIALHGKGSGASVGAQPKGDMKPPTPRPGQKGKAAAHPAAPRSQAMGIHGKGGSASAGSGLARQALRGGGMAGPMQLRVQSPPSLPAPVHGQQQSGRRKHPGQSKLQ